MTPPASSRPLELCDAEDALSILNALSDGLFLIERGAGVCRPVNAAATAMVAELHEDLSTELPLERFFPDFDFSSTRDMEGTSHLAHFPSSKAGALCDVYVQFRRLNLGNRSGLVGEHLLAIVRHISIKASADGLSLRDAFDDVFHDPLTRLPNRRLFARRLERAVQRGASSNYHYAVLFVDLDRFKTVNDRLGHLLGDRLLISAAHRLVEAVRPQDMVARRDGDEFTILLDDLDRPEDAVNVAERIAEYLGRPFLVEGESSDGQVEVTLGASIGVALPGNSTLTAEELISQADAAMYQAKSLGGSTFAILTSCGAKPKPR
jgi:diguanylate cyclase (GGDEF)-like protein